MTSLGNFPGVSLKLNGLSAFTLTEKIMNSTAANERNGARISGTKQWAPEFSSANTSGFAAHEPAPLEGSYDLLHNQHQQQLSAANLWAFNNQRTAFA